MILIRKILIYILFKCNNLLCDRIYLSWMFYLRCGYKLDWKNPKTFCEKIQWLKLYNINTTYTDLVDKYEVKRIVANLIGEEYIIPTLGVWESFDEIDFDKLPKQFVLKCTHDSGGLVIVKDKSLFNINEVRKKIESSLCRDYSKLGREWPYRDVKRRILAESFIECSKDDLTDYKFYCFNGTPAYCQVIQNRSKNEAIDFYDIEWIHQPFTGLVDVATSFDSIIIEKPINYSKMIEIASLLSQSMPFVRVDLYNIEGRIYFGELTFYPASGFGSFVPKEWNLRMGDLIKLPCL